MKPPYINEFTKEEASKWLSELSLACSGKKDELISRIKSHLKWPKLIQKLKFRTKRQSSFPCSLDSNEIPQPSTSWTLQTSFYLNVSDEIFNAYASLKKEGSMGQQEKAYRMLQSRKIVSVKASKTNTDAIFVKAVISRSYGHKNRPAVILFQGSMPQKAHCDCPIGCSGLCCHVLALLLYLNCLLYTSPSPRDGLLSRMPSSA